RLVVHGTLITQGNDDAAGARLEDGSLVLRLSGGALLYLPPGTSVPVHACSAYVDEDGWEVVTLGRAPANVGRDGRMLGGYTLVQLSARIVLRDSTTYAERRWHPVAGSWDQIGWQGDSKVPAEMLDA